MATVSALVVGGAVEDISLTVPARVQSGRLVLPARDKLVAEHTERSIGGGGVSLAVALARLNLRVTCVAAVGDDTIGEIVAQSLREAGVTPHLAIERTQTGISAVLRTGKQHWIVEDRGANDHLRWSHLQSYLKPAPRLLVLSHLSGAANAIIARLAREVPAATELIWNPGTTQITRGVGAARSLLRRTTVLVINRAEIAEWFGGRHDRAALHRAIAGLLSGGVQVVVVTDGKRGATAFQRTDARLSSTHVGSFVRRTVDTVGAGDAFTAGFAALWVQTHDVRRALVAGSLNAAATIALPGALGGLLNAAELRRQLKRALA